MSDLEKAREFFGQDFYATRATGIVIEEVGEHFARCSFEITRNHQNAYGGVMGGVIFTLADFALAVIANHIHYPSVASQISINYLNAPKGKKLIARAECIKDGRTTSIINIDVMDDTDRHIARLTGTAFKK